MKRGFTLIELLLASSLCVMVFGAIFGMFISVFQLAKEASDEMQAVLHARALREQLYYNVKTEGGVVYSGLWQAHNIGTSQSGIEAGLRFTSSEGNPAWLTVANLPDRFTFEKSSSIGANGAALRQNDEGEDVQLYAYLTVEMGKGEKFKYKDRVVIPLAGARQTLPKYPGTCGALDDDVSYYQYRYKE